MIALAAGLKKAVGAPYDPLDAWIAGELAVGVALFLACDVGFRRTLGIPGGGVRLAAAAAALATIPLGTELGGDGAGRRAGGDRRAARLGSGAGEGEGCLALSRSLTSQQS